MWYDWMWYVLAGGGGVWMITLWYQRTTRMYRLTIQDGVLVNQRKSVLLPWRWAFNDSEEDHLNRMKNELMMAREKAKLLARRIPQETDRLKKKKDKLQENSGSVGVPYRDRWRARRDPVRLIEDINTSRKKSKSKPLPAKPILSITPAQQ